MSNALTVLNENNGLAQQEQGGIGLDFSSKLFKIKPATISIIQPSSQKEGARGNLYVSDTGAQFKEMFVTLLVMPKEQRQYHIGGGQGELNRIPENLMCFSRDMIYPDKNAKIPQALKCQGCPQNDWGPWNDKKNETGIKDKTLIPQCDASYYALFIDSVYKMPLQMFIRSKARDEFEKGMGILAKMIGMRIIENKKAGIPAPNIFDVKFRITTKLVTQGQYKFYVPVFDQFEFVTDEDREAFGEVYKQYTANAFNQDAADQEAALAEAEAENIAGKNSSINSQLADDLTEDGEIVV